MMQNMCVIPLQLMQKISDMTDSDNANKESTSGAENSGFKLGNIDIPPEFLSKLMQIDMSPENLSKLQKFLDVTLSFIPEK